MKNMIISKILFAFKLKRSHYLIMRLISAFHVWNNKLREDFNLSDSFFPLSQKTPKKNVERELTAKSAHSFHPT